MSNVSLPSGLGYSLGLKPAAGLSFSWSAYLCRGREGGRGGGTSVSTAHLSLWRRRVRAVPVACLPPTSHPPTHPPTHPPVAQRPRRAAPQEVRVHRGVGDAAPQAGAQAERGPDVAFLVQLGLDLQRGGTCTCSKGERQLLPLATSIKAKGSAAPTPDPTHPLNSPTTHAQLTHDDRSFVSYAERSSGRPACAVAMASNAASAASMPLFMAVWVPCTRGHRVVGCTWGGGATRLPSSEPSQQAGAPAATPTLCTRLLHCPCAFVSYRMRRGGLP